VTAPARPRNERRWRLVRARRDAVPQSLRRVRRRLRPGRGLWRPALFALAAAVVIGAGAWILYGTSLLAVRQIEVSGSTIAGPEAVLAAAGVVEGTPLLRVDTDDVAHRVGTLPSVAQVDVRRSWPDTLVITVTERAAVAVVAQPGGFAVLDATGVVFNQTPSPPPGAVLIRVAAPGPEDRATVAALRVVSALTPQLRAVVGAVVADSPMAIVLELTDGRTIIWGDAESSDVKARVASALLDRAENTIDVSVPDIATTR
jgi:cell division protein FtsQ